MLYIDALNQIIDDGIDAARADYTKPQDKLKLDGSIHGFEECRNKQPNELQRLLVKARDDAEERFREQSEDYWYWRCRALEIEWVCNVVSAILHAQGAPLISAVTARGMMKAAEIIGIAEP